MGKFAHGNSPNLGTLVSDLDMEFRVERSTIWFEHKAEFRLWNPSRSTMQMVMGDGNSVIFRAGYQDEVVGTIWVGQIGLAYPIREGRDTVLHIHCTSGRGGQYRLARVRVAMSFAAGTKVVRILEDIAAYAGLALGGLRNLGDWVELGSPLTLVGDLRTVLRALGELVLSEYGATLYVDNNQLMVFRAGGDKSELELTLLTRGSGLISATPMRDEGKNAINYRQDLLYWSGMSERMDTVVQAEQAFQDATKAFVEAIGDAKEVARQKMEQTHAALLVAQERAQVVLTTGQEPEKAEDLARRNTVRFKALLNPKITPNSLIEINTDLPAQPGLARGTYLVEKCVYEGDNMGGDFSVSGEAFA